MALLSESEAFTVQETASIWPTDPLVIALVGPTGVGKTAAAVALAERLHGEVINADSMQIYRGMDIGTAKPTARERERVGFHMLDIANPDMQYSVSEWKRNAELAIHDVASRGLRPIVCGGTGLYIKALLDDWKLAETPADTVVRDRLRAEGAALGAASLHARLLEVDPVSGNRLHPNDGVRVVRALEVYEVTGRPISDFQEKDRERRAGRHAIRIGLSLNRDTLNRRIDLRVNSMITSGFEAEVQILLDQGYSSELGPLKSLGYKEMISYLRGDMTEHAAIEAMKTNTRRFAKRQQTWFRADPAIEWINCDDWVDGTSFGSATDALIERVNAASK